MCSLKVEQSTKWNLDYGQADIFRLEGARHIVVMEQVEEYSI